MSALPVPPPEEPSLRPGSESARKQWASTLRSAETPQVLSDLLQQYAKLLPRSAFKKGFRKWWLADGGLDEGKAKEKVDKELRRLGEVGSSGKPEKKNADRERKEEEKGSKSELPPPRAESAHQVMLRLHLLDAGLIYC